MSFRPRQSPSTSADQTWIGEARHQLSLALCEPGLISACEGLLRNSKDPAAYRLLSQVLDELSERRALSLARSQRESGLHYTPTPLVARLVQTLFASSDRAARFVEGRILDPACGSGRFLVAALSELLRRGVSPRVALNQVAGFDLDPVAVEVSRARLWLEACAYSGRLLLERPQSVEVANALEMKTSAALVLGNPPFRSPGGRAGPGALGTPAPFVIGDQLLRGRRSLALDFLAKATEWLEEQGTLALLVPDSLLINQNFTAVRRALVLRGWLEQSWLFRKPVFRSASVGAAVLIWRKSAPGMSELIEVKDHHQQPWLEQSWRCAGEKLIAHPRCRLDGRPGLDEDLLARQGFAPLGERCEIRDGINTGSSALRKQLLVRAKDHPGAALIEVLDGQSVRPFFVGPSPWRLTDIELSREERRAGASLRKPEVFRSPRLVYRQTADRPIVAIERAARWTLNSVHNLHLKEASGELLRALCGWLNSDVCARIYRELSGETRREFPQVHIATMRLLPVPHALFLLSDRRTQQLAHIVKLLEETTDAATDFTHPLRVELEALCQALFEKPTGEA